MYTLWFKHSQVMSSYLHVLWGLACHIASCVVLMSRRASKFQCGKKSSFTEVQIHPARQNTQEESEHQLPTLERRIKTEISNDPHLCPAPTLMPHVLINMQAAVVPAGESQNTTETQRIICCIVLKTEQTFGSHVKRTWMKLLTR